MQEHNRTCNNDCERAKTHLFNCVAKDARPSPVYFGKGLLQASSLPRLQLEIHLYLPRFQSFPHPKRLRIVPPGAKGERGVEQQILPLLAGQLWLLGLARHVRV